MRVKLINEHLGYPAIMNRTGHDGRNFRHSRKTPLSVRNIFDVKTKLHLEGDSYKNSKRTSRPHLVTPTADHSLEKIATASKHLYTAILSRFVMWFAFVKPTTINNTVKQSTNCRIFWPVSLHTHLCLNIDWMTQSKSKTRWRAWVVPMTCHVRGGASGTGGWDGMGGVEEDTWIKSGYRSEEGSVEGWKGFVSNFNFLTKSRV